MRELKSDFEGIFMMNENVLNLRKASRWDISRFWKGCGNGSFKIGDTKKGT